MFKHMLKKKLERIAGEDLLQEKLREMYERNPDNQNSPDSASKEELEALVESFPREVGRVIQKDYFEEKTLRDSLLQDSESSVRKYFNNILDEKNTEAENVYEALRNIIRARGENHYEDTVFSGISKDKESCSISFSRKDDFYVSIGGRSFSIYKNSFRRASLPEASPFDVLHLFDQDHYEEPEKRLNIRGEIPKDILTQILDGTVDEYRMDSIRFVESGEGCSSYYTSRKEISSTDMLAAQFGRGEYAGRTGNPLVDNSFFNPFAPGGIFNK